MTTLAIVKDDAYSKLAAAITDVATTMTVTTGEGANFPNTYPFYLSIEDEMVRVTNRSTDTMTIVRAQESTSGVAHSLAMSVSLNIISKHITDLNTIANRLEADVPTYVAKGDMRYASAGATGAVLSIGTDNYIMAVATDVPAWKSPAEILADISPLTTRGDMIFRNATVTTRLAKGADNTILAMGASDPEWKTPAIILGDLTGANFDVGAFDVRGATVTADALTSGRVVFAGASGVLSDDADFTFATDTLTVTKIGAFEATGAINFASQNMTNVDIDSGTIGGITLDGTVTLNGQILDAGAGYFQVNSTQGGFGAIFRCINDGANGVFLQLRHESASPAVDDKQRIVFVSRDGAGGMTEHGFIQLGMNNVGDGTEVSSFVVALVTGGAATATKMTLTGAGILNVVGSYQVDAVQVVGNRVIDARCDDAINSGDATTDGVIDALRDAMITHGLIAAA